MNIVRDVVGAVCIRDGKLFSARRGESKYPYVAHKYEFVGGKREDGETCENALKRECREEMGIEIKIVRPFMTYRYVYPDFIIYLHTFIVEFSEEPRLTEHEEFSWLDLEDINPDDWAPADQEALKKLTLCYGDISEKKVSSETLYAGHVLTLKKDVVLLPNGKEGIREVVHHKGASAVLVVNEKNECFFCSQYRYPFGEIVLEIPAGKRDTEEEDYFDTAKREIKEELGVIDAEMIPLGFIYPTVGYSDEKIALYVARHPSFGEQNLDEDEFLSVNVVPLQTAYEMIVSGEIKDAKTIIALLRYKEMTDL